MVQCKQQTHLSFQMHAELQYHLWTVAGWLLQCLEAHCCLCRLLQQRSIRWFLVCRQSQLVRTDKQCMRHNAKCRSGRHCSPFDSHKLRCICRYLVYAAIGLPNDWLQGALLLAHFDLTACTQGNSYWLLQLSAPVRSRSKDVITGASRLDVQRGTLSS